MNCNPEGYGYTWLLPNHNKIQQSMNNSGLSDSEVTLKDTGKTNQYFTTTKHNKTWTVCIIHGMYWASFSVIT